MEESQSLKITFILKICILLSLNRLDSFTARCFQSMHGGYHRNPCQSSPFDN
jgi:hypothetical protein